MSRLLKLLDWVTVPEAARHLSSILSEQVSEADILRLALDGRIVLSVNFVNHAQAQRGRVVPLHDAPTAPGLPIPGVEPYKVVLGHRLPGGEHVVVFDKEVTELSGVWDLPMIGSESLDVQHTFQRLTGGPEVTLIGMDGTFVNAPDGCYFKLLARYEKNEHFRKDKLQKPWSHPDNFYPAGGLPEDAVLVVRTKALADFQAKLAGEEVRERKGDALGTRERDTLLKLVIGMAMKGYRYDPASSRSPATAEIVEDLAKLGIAVTDDTVRKWLRVAAETMLPKRQPRT